MECPALWKVLYNLSGSGQSAVSILLGGSHLLPSQLPGEYTAVLPHMVHSTFKPFTTMTSLPYTGRDRNLVVGHKFDDPHVVFNVHQSHRHDSTHPNLFLPSWVPLVYMWSAAQLGIVMYDTLWSNAGRTVTHPYALYEGNVRWRHIKLIFYDTHCHACDI